VHSAAQPPRPRLGFAFFDVSGGGGGALDRGGGGACLTIGFGSPKITRPFVGLFFNALAQSVGAGCLSGFTPSTQIRHIPAGGLYASV
jgi:hypothetical protein